MNTSRTNPWLVCLLPFIVYMVAGSFEPGPPPADGAEAAKPWIDLGIEYRHYPLVYTAKIVLTLAAMAFVWPGYRQYTGRVGWLAVVIGVVGTAVWVALAHLQRWGVAQSDIGWLQSYGSRSAFNPLEELRDQGPMAYAFLAVRFLGLVAIVPVIEEFFLRGFLMRFVMAEKWWEVPFGNVNQLAVIVGTAVPVLMHPQEALAAAVWFSAVTWLMVRTRSIWSCILAHAITNALLGAYVLATGEWWLM